MWRNVATVYGKEMLEVLRDKKTIVFMLIVPALVVPTVINGFITFVMRTEARARTEVLSYAMLGAEHLPELARRFEERSDFTRVELPEGRAPKEAIEDETIRFAVVIPPGAARLDELTTQATTARAPGGLLQYMTEGRDVEVPRWLRKVLGTDLQVAIEVYYDNADTAGRARQRATRVIRDFAHEIRTARLRELGVETPAQRAALLDPILIEERGTAPMREVVGTPVGGVLPYLFIIFCFMGALYPAIDLGAGEKERGTLETLLLAPIPRSQIVLGKFLIIFTTGVTAAIVTITSLGVWIYMRLGDLRGAVAELFGSITVLDLTLIAAALIPIAAMFASILLAVSIYAKSFKEAQSYAVPFNILIVVPAMFAMLPGMELNWGTALIPVTNIALAIRELISGTIDYAILSLILATSLAIAGGLLVFCTYWFRREDVLFRQ